LVPGRRGKTQGPVPEKSKLPSVPDRASQWRTEHAAAPGDARRRIPLIGAGVSSTDAARVG